ncbi:MAG: L,D-transpeptidase family protein [Rhodobacteraceae bacterium]|nr:L,D-transpeptidase family protein [Paracoccaceae bacterium]
MTVPRPGDLVVGRWGARFRGRRLPCAIGRGGIRADKREGDGATPAGCHRVTGALYRPDRRGPGGLPGRARAVLPRDLWSDDPADAAYNRLVRAPHHHRHERLRRPDRLYDLVLLTDWNRAPAVPGRGSAIFLHRWRKPRHPTAGCIAFAPADLRWIARRLLPRDRLVIGP